MPELPEVETVARELDPLVKGRRIESLAVLDSKLKNRAFSGLRGAKIQRVFRVGKLVTFELKKAREVFYLAVHLRMTGRLIWVPQKARSERKHLRLILKLNGGEVRFFDPRRFGTVELVRSLDEISPDAIDPMTVQFKADALKELLGQSKQPLKTWLLRQDRLVGIGNIYASEILFTAKLHPNRGAGSLKAPELSKLHRATKQILAKAIENCGTTFSDFQGAHGLTGNYGRFLKVYEREGKSCVRCKTVIERFVQGQRSTYFCPGCQR